MIEDDGHSTTLNSYVSSLDLKEDYYLSLNQTQKAHTGVLNWISSQMLSICAVEFSQKGFNVQRREVKITSVWTEFTFKEIGHKVKTNCESLCATGTVQKELLTVVHFPRRTFEDDEVSIFQVYPSD